MIEVRLCPSTGIESHWPSKEWFGFGVEPVPFTLTAVRDIWHMHFGNFWSFVPVLVLGSFEMVKDMNNGCTDVVLLSDCCLPVIASSHLASERYMYRIVWNGTGLFFTRADSPKAWRAGLILLLAYPYIIQKLKLGKMIHSCFKCHRKTTSILLQPSFRIFLSHSKRLCTGGDFL